MNISDTGSDNAMSSCWVSAAGCRWVSQIIPEKLTLFVILYARETRNSVLSNAGFMKYKMITLYQIQRSKSLTVNQIRLSGAELRLRGRHISLIGIAPRVLDCRTQLETTKLEAGISDLGLHLHGAALMLRHHLVGECVPVLDT